MIKIQLHKSLHSAIGKMHLDVDLSIEPGTFLTLYGKSGAGKTSILRMLSGLMKPDSGFIQLTENTWYDSESKINLGPQKRSLGYVFQDYALFPNMTVKENLEFALLKNQDSKIIKELIEIVELGDLQDRKTTTLSGGQQQRIALARSLVQRPDVLLLDEPLSALDQEMRQKLQHYILQVHKEYSLTTILVSHDIPEILKMSDRIAQLEQGEIVKDGEPSDFFKSNNTLGPLPLKGKVIRVEKKEENIILIVKTVDGQMEIEIPANQFPLP